ncbi:BolA family protein [Candidatus Accumulibacter vicinus]|uniref:BolA family protein n=1 Tax=Candidatus Accumulibacter vicinus TaxID=2954382 RepID=UPI00235B5E6D|nr:BolA family protein [Candidatus Accumulibacter vicinus]
MTDAPAAGAAASVVTNIQQRLTVLAPIRLEVIDDSARHTGHAGAQGGGGHYRLLIVSDAFADLARLARHRLVHAALDDLMPIRIHALSIQALTPAEYSAIASITS